MKCQLKICLLFLFICNCAVVFSQTAYTLTPSQKNEDCTKGSAAIDIQGLQSTDTITVAWSNGQSGVFSITDIDAGNYNVHVTIKNKIDTTVNFAVTKEKCKVVASNHFTPNGDSYNDTWQLGNTDRYPNFELYVFNKWGQQVHSQKGNYTPWDGKWNGINVLDGTYYFVFYYDGGNKHDFVKGDVTILR